MERKKINMVVCTVVQTMDDVLKDDVLDGMGVPASIIAMALEEKGVCTNIETTTILRTMVSAGIIRRNSAWGLTKGPKFTEALKIINDGLAELREA